MTFELTFNRYAATAAERITDVSAMLQRNWRRHGYLPTNEGHARFDLFELAQLRALGMLAARGVGPNLGIDVSEIIAAGITLGALRCRGAYEGDAEMLNVEADDEATAEMRRAVEAKGMDFGREPLAWGAKADTFARAAFRGREDFKTYGRAVPARFFMWFPDGSHRWDNSVDACFRSDRFPTDGPVIVIDQHAVGAKMVERAPQPFVRVERSPR